MRIKVRGVKNIYISGEYIKLDALLKFASIASTGGEAKHLIQSGSVLVDGDVCDQRGKKVKPGNIVRCGGDTLLIKQAGI